jgi:hypothetical protein
VDWSNLLYVGSGVAVAVVGYLAYRQGRTDANRRHDAERLNQVKERAVRDSIVWGVPAGDGIEHRPGFDERLADVETWRTDVSTFIGETRDFITRTDERTEQLMRNGGKSILDRVVRIDDTLTAHVENPDAHATSRGSVEART